ncbi:MAG: helix-hairpin-helix domain-containing protein [Syntrophomonadaceae bacterium]|jgi:competence protein ComEA
MQVDKRGMVFIAILMLIVFSIGVKYSDYKHSQEIADDILISTLPALEEEVLKLEPCEDSSKIIKVYVTGAVKYPGVYSLQENDRMHEAIELAGGALEEAELKFLDMARLLVDGETILIPLKGEVSENQVVTGVNNSLGSSSQSSGKVNINTASVQEMADKLDGIGPSLAQRIVDYRNSNGMFKNIEEIKNISGIGDKRFEAIKDKLTVR